MVYLRCQFSFDRNNYHIKTYELSYESPGADTQDFGKEGVRLAVKDRQQSIRPILVRAQYIDNWYLPTSGPYIWYTLFRSSF